MSSEIAKKMKHVGWAIMFHNHVLSSTWSPTRRDAIAAWDKPKPTFEHFRKRSIAKAVKLYVEVPDGK